MIRAGTIASLLLALALAAPFTATASYDPVGGGSAKLQLNTGFRSFLRGDGIQVTATAGAVLRAGTLSLPVAGGRVDPTAKRAKVELAGEIVFRNGRQRVPLRKIEVTTGHSPLVAKVGGSQLKVASAAHLEFRRQGFGSLFLASDIRLTPKAATRLNKKLRPRVPLEAGQLVGWLVTTPQPRTTALMQKGRVQDVLDPGLVAKLEGRLVSINPIFPAEHVTSDFTFPIIANGSLAPDATSGVLRTGGEIEFLELGGGQIFWHELWFDFAGGSTLAEVDAEPSPGLPGRLGQVPILQQGSGTVSSEPSTRTIGVSGLPVYLVAESARLFNQAFAEGDEIFHAGEPAGVVSFIAVGQ